MKTRTRVVAWLYILLQIPAVIVTAVLVPLLLVSGTGVVAGLLKTELFSPWVEKIIGLGVVYLGLLIAGVVLFGLLPWIYLLKEREWAWWVLTVVNALAVIGSLLGSDDLLSFPLIAILTLLVLLTDRPPSWRSKRSSRRRRKTGRRKRR